MVDNPVPGILLDQCANRDGNEFEKMRYTAITCDPDDFVVRGLMNLVAIPANDEVLVKGLR